jgi:heme-degrading monooxygenase HmoA
MHARIGALHVYPEHFERVLQILRERVIPAAQRQPGFSAFVLMANQEEGKVVSTTFWETEQDMLASESAEYLQDQVSRAIPLLRGPPEFELYEVVEMS